MTLLKFYNTHIRHVQTGTHTETLTVFYDARIHVQTGTSHVTAL